MLTPTQQTVATVAQSNWFTAIFAFIGGILSAPISRLVTVFGGNKTIQADATKAVDAAEALAPAAATILAATGNPSAAAAVATAATLAKSVQASHTTLLLAIAKGAPPAVISAMADQHKGALQAALSSANAVAKALDTISDVKPGA